MYLSRRLYSDRLDVAYDFLLEFKNVNVARNPISPAVQKLMLMPNIYSTPSWVFSSLMVSHRAASLRSYSRRMSLEAESPSVAPLPQRQVVWCRRWKAAELYRSRRAGTPTTVPGRLTGTRWLPIRYLDTGRQRRYLLLRPLSAYSHLSTVGV